MRHLFCINFQKFNGDISEWDTSNVTDMRCMFINSKFNGNISKWNTSKVCNVDHMFERSNFNGDISGWDLHYVTPNLIDMFKLSPISKRRLIHNIPDCIKKSKILLDLSGYNSNSK